jgi:DNA-binding GntR family transcriptional regulator
VYDSLQIEQSSTVERVVDELRRALFDGELTPGTPLREVALAEAMRVSRGTIREALGALVGEGLAVREPHRGVSVNALSRSDVRDVCRARAALEIAGVRQWAAATPEARDAVRRALADYDRVAGSGVDTADLTAAHLAVHRALVGLTGSERLLATADALAAEVRLALADVDRVRRNSRQQVSAHSHLVDLLERGEIATAARELEDHLAHAEESMTEAISRRDRKDTD